MITDNIINKVISNVYLRRSVQAIMILILIWLLWSFGNYWLRPMIIKGLGGYTARQVQERIDTLEVKRDTVWLKHKEVETKVVNIEKPVVVYKYKTLPNPNTTGKNSPSSSSLLDSVYTYSHVISDTLINGNIETVVNPIDCKIIAQKLKYKPKFPIIVKEYITVEKTKTETLYDKPKAKIGIGLTGTSNNEIGGLGVYQTSKNWQIQGGYIKSLNSNVYSSNTSGNITVSIIKLF